MGTAFGFAAGPRVGAAAGAIHGVALAPRSGAETRAMAADIANDAWDNMRDTYEHSAEEARAELEQIEMHRSYTRMQGFLQRAE